MTDQELANILFVDIETASGSPDYQTMDHRLREHWDRKAGFLNNPDSLSPDKLYFDRAGIYAEFGKILTIAVGFIIPVENTLGLRVKAFSGDDESRVLLDFKELLETKFSAESLKLCAHNGKEFDFPFICRRMLIQGIPLPEILDVRDKKPWEYPYIDTMNLWKFGDRKNYTSLDLLAALFKVESSKNDLHGSMVNQVYHREGGLDRIEEYCKRDVIVTAQLFLKLNSLPPIAQHHITVL